MDENDQALVNLGKELRAHNYRFITTTPSTHHRVSNRSVSAGSPLSRIFGWNLPFSAGELPPQIFALMQQAGELTDELGSLRSKVRFYWRADIYPFRISDRRCRQRFLRPRYLQVRACAPPCRG